MNMNKNKQMLHKPLSKDIRPQARVNQWSTLRPPQYRKIIELEAHQEIGAFPFINVTFPFMISLIIAVVSTQTISSY